MGSYHNSTRLWRHSVLIRDYPASIHLLHDASPHQVPPPHAYDIEQWWGGTCTKWQGAYQHIRKNEKKRSNLAKGYYKDDCFSSCFCIIEENQGLLEYERIFLWRTDMMEVDRNVCCWSYLPVQMNSVLHHNDEINRDNDHPKSPLLAYPKSTPQEDLRGDSTQRLMKQEL